ncbi:MAG: hypothetical protein V9G19_15650 [Tetrasphaera sp.]
MHRIHGDHASAQVTGIEAGQQVAHGGDLVATWRLDLILAQDDAGGVVERGDQMRRGRVAAVRAPRTVLPSIAITRRPPPI